MAFLQNTEQGLTCFGCECFGTCMTSWKEITPQRLSGRRQKTDNVLLPVEAAVGGTQNESAFWSGVAVLICNRKKYIDAIALLHIPSASAIHIDRLNIIVCFDNLAVTLQEYTELGLQMYTL